MGKVESEAPAVLLADADVLIDYRDADLPVLKEVGKHVGRLAVLSHVLNEVAEVTERQCASLGIEVIGVETKTLLEAAQLVQGVSFNDSLCFVVCREQGWTCVTNDGALRRLCRRHDVAVCYGLGLMVDLVRVGTIDRRRATTIARRMHIANPSHINKHVLARFRRVLADQGHPPA